METNYEIKQKLLSLAAEKLGDYELALKGTRFEGCESDFANHFILITTTPQGGTDVPCLLVRVPNTLNKENKAKSKTRSMPFTTHPSRREILSAWMQARKERDRIFKEVCEMDYSVDNLIAAGVTLSAGNKK